MEANWTLMANYVTADLQGQQLVSACLLTPAQLPPCLVFWDVLTVPASRYSQEHLENQEMIGHQARP